MDKLALKDTLIKAHRETLEELKTEYATNRTGENLSLDDVHDADDHSHRKQTEEYLQAMEKQIHQREMEIERLRSLDFSRKTLGGGSSAGIYFALLTNVHRTNQ